MTIINFINRFPDEASCIAFIKEQRIQEGIFCKKCTGNKHYWLENKLSFQCASCGFRTSIRSGTVMQSSN
ncbi:transposase-like zinc ribbon protein, partial [Algoriphagus yeomjeoni]